MADSNDRRLIKGATVVVEENGAVRTTDGKQALRWASKSTDSKIIYVGTAPVNSLNASAVWSISEIDTTNGSIKYADYGQYNQIWDDRESLSYG